MPNDSLQTIRGFTLMEVLLVLALLGLLGALAVPFYQTFYVQTQLDTTTAEIMGALRSSQLNSFVGNNNTTHGVHVASNNFVVFQGDSYVPGDPNNFVTDLPPTVGLTTSFGTNIIFAGRTGVPDQTGTITITARNYSHTLSINALGTIGQTN